MNVRIRSVSNGFIIYDEDQYQDGYLRNPSKVLVALNPQDLAELIEDMAIKSNFEKKQDGEK